MGLKDTLSALMPRKVFNHIYNSGTSEWDPETGSLAGIESKLDQYTPVDVDTDGADTLNALPVAVMLPGAEPAALPGDSTSGAYVHVKATVVPYAVLQAPATDNGTSALSVQVAPGFDWELIGIKLHLDANGGSGDLTITEDADAGAEHDVVLFRADMANVKDVVWLPERAIPMGADDTVTVAWANTGGATWGLQAYYARRY